MNVWTPAWFRICAPPDTMSFTWRKFRPLRAMREQVARIERSEIRERSRRSDADPGFHCVQSGLRLLVFADLHFIVR
jgi:hypothetical protein